MLIIKIKYRVFLAVQAVTGECFAEKRDWGRGPATARPEAELQK